MGFMRFDLYYYMNSSRLPHKLLLQTSRSIFSVVSFQKCRFGSKKFQKLSHPPCDWDFWEGSKIYKKKLKNGCVTILDFFFATFEKFFFCSFKSSFQNAFFPPSLVKKEQFGFLLFFLSFLIIYIMLLKILMNLLVKKNTFQKWSKK